MQKLENLKILVSGQALVGRLETLEDYLRDRVDTLGVIGIDNISSPKRLARLSLYKNKAKVKTLPLPSIRLRRKTPFNNLLLIASFLMQFLTIFFSIMFLGKQFDIFIGVGCFPTFVGVVLKKIKRIKHCIYYCIDYFPVQKKISFNYFLLKVLLYADLLCVKYSDLTWHISPLIPQARKKYTGFDKSKYNYIDVPLCFNERLLNIKPLDKIERNTLAFVGTSGYFHGLNLLFEALPYVIREAPEIKIKIIGVGPWDEFQKKIKDAGIEKHFIIRGYIEDDLALTEELSYSAAGLALYIPVEENPSVYADPGKPKLYAFCGLPLIITKTPYVAKEISDRKAGIVIDYTKEDLAGAIIEILKNDDKYQLYRKNAFSFANDYTHKKIYDCAFAETLPFIYNLRTKRKVSING